MERMSAIWSVRTWLRGGIKLEMRCKQQLLDLQLRFFSCWCMDFWIHNRVGFTTEGFTSEIISHKAQCILAGQTVIGFTTEWDSELRDL